MALFEQGYAVVIGVASYRSPQIRNLPWVRHDIDDIAQLLRNPSRCGYPQDHVRCLHDATAGEIRRGLGWLADETGDQDTAVVYFSGHGWSLDEPQTQQQSYLLAHDAQLRGENEVSGAIDSIELTALLNGIRASRLAVFLDCCYSGAAGEVKQPRAGLPRGFKSGLRDDDYTELGQGVGRVIIASSLPGQESLAFDYMRNSLFTHYLLEALNGRADPNPEGHLGILGVFKFLSVKVPQHAQRQHAQRQKPLLKAETPDDFLIALRRSEPPKAQIEAPSPTAGQEQIHRESGMTLIYVPGGKYLLGAEDVGVDAKPPHRVELDPFWIGKYPVTNEQYAKFLDANPEHREPRCWANENFNRQDQPVVGVDWEDALAYCRWADLELPTEAQWEAAARGADQRPYPWGDTEPTEDHTNFGLRENRPAAVGIYTKGANPYGIMDQAGNVWEWCRDAWDTSAYTNRHDEKNPIGTRGNHKIRVVRGGSWQDSPEHLRSAFRDRWPTDSRTSYIGFRCVLDRY